MKLTKLSAALAKADGPMIKLAAAVAAATLAMSALAACGTAAGNVEVLPPTGESDLVAPGADTSGVDVSDLTGDYDAAKDVTLGKCTVGEFGEVTAPVTVRNSTDVPRSYTVTAELVRGAERVTTVDAYVNHLRAGQNIKATASGYVDDPKTAKGTTCKLLTITSYEDTL